VIEMQAGKTALMYQGPNGIGAGVKTGPEGTITAGCRKNERACESIGIADHSQAPMRKTKASM